MESLPEALLEELDRRLAPVDAARLAAFPGDRPERQPVHTCYVPADAMTPGLAERWGAEALAALDEHGLPDIGLDPALADQVLPRVRAKLATEPVEDLRIDAEDGYRGARDREDDDVCAAAAALAADVRAGTAPPWWGIRAKSLELGARHRGLRSLDLFLTGFRAETADFLPGGTVIRPVITLPKVTDVEQVHAFLPVLDSLEATHGAAVHLELQIETPQAVIGPDGLVTAAPLVRAGGSRLLGLHYGTYDYSAALGIAAAHQSSDHPAADFAKQVLQVAVAGTGVRAVDGSTNVLPVGDREAVHAAWRIHAGLVRRALERGFYQGWDLHPAQLVTRYTATYAFYRAALPPAVRRLAAYLDRTGGGVLDEPATARALAAVLVRGLDCGALDEEEIRAGGGPEPATLAKLSGRRPGGS